MVAIIVLNWNGLNDTLKCLQSLIAVNYSNYSIFLVDNNSSNNEGKIIKEKFGSYIYLIQNKINYGFAEGNNIAIRHIMDNSVPDYVLLLNNDTVVHPDFLMEMVKLAETDSLIGIIGPKTYLFGSNNKFQLATVKINLWTSQTIFTGTGKVDMGQYDDIQDIDYCQGSCFLIKREVIETVGLLDPSFFVYWEENDYCLRAKKEGFRIVYCTKAKIWHKDWSRAKGPHTNVRINSHAVYYLSLNRFRFMKKHATTLQKITASLCYFGFELWFLSIIYLIYHHSVRGFKSLLKGSINGVRLLIK